MRGNGRFYLGQHNTTKGGLSCQPWYTPHPHQHTSPPQVIDDGDGDDDDGDDDGDGDDGGGGDDSGGDLW